MAKSAESHLFSYGFLSKDSVLNELATRELHNRVGNLNVGKNKLN